MSSGLDDLEQRGRWGRKPAAVKPPPAPNLTNPTRPAESRPEAASSPPPKSGINRKRSTKAITKAEKEGVERVVVYLSREQTAWIRDRQIAALRAGKRVSASSLIRELIARALASS